MTLNSLSTIDLVEEYLQKTTWKGAENANSTYSHQGLIQHISGHVVAEYWLKHVYPEEVRRYSEENRFHIHDLGFLSAYCSGWSIHDVLLQGFGGVPNKIQCRPPKHLNTALNQTVNFLFTLQGELAGAQALSNMDTYLAPFIRLDKLTYDEVFKYVQSFIYSLNVPTRSGFQAPFTNISLDIACPKTLESQPVIIGGEYQTKWVYGDFQDEMDTFNQAFTAVMVQGDGNGNAFSFPIATYNLSPLFDWDSPRYESIWEMTAKYGIPYFANFVNSDLNPEDFRSMCCRLRLDVRKLHSRAGGLFSAAPLTGSIGVVTLNLPNLALRCNGTKTSFLEVIDDTLRVAKESLEVKRQFVDAHSLLYPYAAHYLSAIKQRTGSHWTNHFSTIGLNGMNEALLVLFGPDSGGISTQKAFALSVITHIKDILQKFQSTTDNLYNLEATPAESTSYKLAQRDRDLFPDKHHLIPSYYTNSTALPVDATSDLFEALSHQEALQCAYTGGTVFHAFLGERLPSGRHARDLIRTITTHYRIPYLSLTPTFSICPAHGYVAGEKPHCPQCQEDCLIYSRIVGYYRPTRDWNKGKKEEFSRRKYFHLSSLSEALFSTPREKEEKNEAMLLPIAGYNPVTYTDWPGKLQAAILFTPRCNLACPWCHNGPIVRERPTIRKTPPSSVSSPCPDGQEPSVQDLSVPSSTVADVISHIISTPHKSLVLSGGEPTIHPQLIPFMRLLKSHSISLKLDTNGTNPGVLSSILAEKLVDFVAMDIKASLARYKQVAGRAVDPEVIVQSVEMIKDSGLPHEFRTTVVPGLVDIEDLMEARDLGGGKLTMQRFRKGQSNLSKRFRKAREHTDEEWDEIKEVMRRAGGGVDG